MVLRHSRNRLVLPKVRDLQELKMTLTDRFDAWAREYERKGREYPSPTIRTRDKMV